jgi:glycosyltransferase involved in cell wall biosynthesis
MLRRSKCSYWLFVVHGWGGGTETAAQNLARLLAAEDVKVFTLRSPVGKGKLRLELPADAIVMEYPADEIGGGLIDDLRAIGVKHVHYHHTIGFDKSVWDIPKLLGINYDVAIHDFYFGCPRVNLIDDSGHFCGQPALEVCERCVEYSGLPEGVEEQFESLGGTVEAWRTFHLERLRRARKVIAPSHDALSRTLQYLPIENGVALPHPEPLARIALTPPPVAGAPLRVAVIGAIGKHKGHDLLVACARHAHRHELPIHFVVVGYTCNDKAYEGLPNLTITGAYEAERLPELLRASHCAVALFMSVWPETFSYTLSEAYRAGLWPVVFDLGAPAERVRATDIGTVIPATKEPAEICKVVTSIGRASIHGARAIEVGSEYASIVEDYYDLTSTKIRTFAMVERATVA